MVQIKNLIPGDEVDDYFLLKRAEIKLTHTSPPKEYLDAIISDKTGEIPAKYWDISSFEKETLNSMKLVRVVGLVQDYQGKLQVKINRIRLATDLEGVKLSDFIRAAPVSTNHLLDQLFQSATQIRHQDLKKIVLFCLEKNRKKIEEYPAAKSMHHDYLGGLAYHVNRMLELANFICQQRPFLNRDLLVAGVLLHDVAKTEEFDACLGVVADYTTIGKLIGHISIANTMVNEAAITLDLDAKSGVVLALQHLILSHHNKGEWGSPVRPRTPEALALHLIDTLDAQLQAVEDAIEMKTPDSEWTQPIRILDNTSFYVSNQ